MEDISPELLANVRSAFEDNIVRNQKLKQLQTKIQSGNGTYADAGEYADELGKALSDAIKEAVSPDILPNGQFYWNIADRVLRPMLETDYAMAAEAAKKVQEQLNKEAGIGIKAQAAQLPQGRVDGILNTVCSGPAEKTMWILETPLQTFCRAAVDDTLQANLKFQSDAGLSPRIERRATGKCCELCARLAGIYEYPEETYGTDVFWRHNSCRCVVEYIPIYSKQRQNVHTKQWTTSEENARIEARQYIGLKAGTVTVKGVSDHVIERVQERSIFPDAISDAMTHPLKVNPVKYDESGRPSIVMIGQKATIAINPDTGYLVTAYPTHTKLAEKLKREKE